MHRDWSLVLVMRCSVRKSLCVMHGAYVEVISGYACYERGLSKQTGRYHGGYGVAVAQRLVEPLVRVQLPIVTPDAESSNKTEKPRFFAISVRDLIAPLFTFYAIRDS